MTDLDTQTLRRALRAAQEPGYPAPGRTGQADVAEIITRGRRLRWRRRAMAAGGSVCLAAALVGAVAGIGRLTTPSPGPAQHVVSPVGPAHPTRPTRPTMAPSPSPRRGHATPSPFPPATAARSTSPTATPTTNPAAPATLGQTPPTPTPTLSASAAVSGGASATSTPSATPSVAG